MVDKDLEALLIDKLKNYSTTGLRSALEEAFAAATIAKKREDEKNLQITDWYDGLVAHLDTGSLSFADAGVVAALAYAARHPEAELIDLVNIANNVASYAATRSKGTVQPEKPIGTTWKFTIKGDPVKDFLEKNGW